MNLLEKIRIINNELQKNADIKDIIKKLPELIYELIGANIYIFSRQGNLLGAAANERMEVNLVHAMINTGTKEGYGTEAAMQVPHEYKKLMKNNCALIVPIISGEERTGSIFINRPQAPFHDEDLILVEYVASFLSVKLQRTLAKREELESQSREKVKMAVRSLTHSEFGAVELIMQELGGKDGLLIASEAAKKFGISRSIIIVALRKLKSAGIIESHSLGVKGTYIKILNDKIFDEVTVTT